MMILLHRSSDLRSKIIKEVGSETADMAQLYSYRNCQSPLQQQQQQQQKQKQQTTNNKQQRTTLLLSYSIAIVKFHILLII